MPGYAGRVVKYLGSKRLLVPAILEAVGGASPRGGAVLDVFSGTSRVGHALKRAGYRVIASDHNAYAATLARCYVQADREDVLGDATGLVAELNRVASRVVVGVGGDGEERVEGGGWFARAYAGESRFFRAGNAARIEAVREAIAAMGLGPELEAVLLASLLEAADRVDSTTGVQMAYLKSWSWRSGRRLELRVPEVLPRAAGGKGEAHLLDAAEAAGRFEADVAYVDPPYNQHSYLGNYHVWETLVRWDAPGMYGVARKREDVRARKSAFNSRRGFEGALRRLLVAVRAPAVVLSFSDEGFVSRERLEALLGEVFGVAAGGATVSCVAHDYARYVGAKIGIHNPRGERVGTVGRLRNREFIYTIRRCGARGMVGGVASGMGGEGVAIGAACGSE